MICLSLFDFCQFYFQLKASKTLYKSASKYNDSIFASFFIAKSFKDIVQLAEWSDSL